MQPDPKNPAPGVDGSITDYQISVNGIPVPPIDMTKDDLCGVDTELCSYVVVVSDDNSAEYYNVSVAAENILGLGATTPGPVGPYSECRYVCAMCLQTLRLCTYWTSGVEGYSDCVMLIAHYTSRLCST